jgi:hypothetical protein
MNLKKRHGGGGPKQCQWVLAASGCQLRSLAESDSDWTCGIYFPSLFSVASIAFDRDQDSMSAMATATSLKITLACAAIASITSAGQVPAWTYDGFARFPALWFGANVSGLDNPVQLALIAKHSLAGYGWQQGVNHTVYRHAETSLAQAAVHLSDFVAANPPSGNVTPTKVFVYRHFQMSWAIFDITRAANANTAYDAMFLRNDDGTGVRCGQADEEHNTSSPLLVYLSVNASGAAEFWVDEVVGEVAAESGVDACFFDETVRGWL